MEPITAPTQYPSSTSTGDTHIVSTPGTCGGRPRIAGHRITVEDVAIWYEHLGMSPDEIVSNHPSIDLADVHAALSFYYSHREDIDTSIAEGERFVAEVKAKLGSGPLDEKSRQITADAEKHPLSSR
jgi:uncharacterized protein (DUF433 family)